MSARPVVVTGATGFVGSAVVRALLDEGMRVRVLVRPNADMSNLQGLTLECVSGDLCAAQSVRQALVGSQGLFHVAARYSLWSRDAEEMYRSNVAGTRNILQAAMDAGLDRVVYTSSVGTLGWSGNSAANEDTPVALADMVGAYKRSKFMAEQVALEFAGKGLPVVIVNPSTPIGARDIKPTPTGRLILDFLAGRMPGYVETGLNFVAVEDVAIGHVLAWKFGVTGRRYILGNQNLTLCEFLAMIAQIARCKAPRLKIPYSVALAAGIASEAASWVTGRPPRAPVVGVLMARKKMFFDCTRALTELGIPQTPVAQAVEQSVRWFRDHGYAA
ncbi:MAG: NAD-dependent epimerase/dehydratase family protein [Cyanobacteria bacterium REEB65]|nr:NAD-dependent epimerase/dehydratase family protein [Cyanobacteria bacterium REEB65]